MIVLKTFAERSSRSSPCMEAPSPSQTKVWAKSGHSIVGILAVLEYDPPLDYLDKQDGINLQEGPPSNIPGKVG